MILKTSKNDGKRHSTHVVVPHSGLGTRGEHADEVSSILERTDRHMVSPIRDGHRTQTQTLHLTLRRQQKSMVDVVEELGPEAQTINAPGERGEISRERRGTNGLWMGVASSSAS